jgi:hypothetical protein
VGSYRAAPVEQPRRADLTLLVVTVALFARS